MFISKNNLVKVFTALIFQFFLTMNLAYAVPCEDVFKEKLENDGQFDESGKKYAFLWNNGRGDMGVVYRSLEDFRNKIYSDAQRYVNKYGSDKSECLDYTKNYSDNRYNKLEACLANVLTNNNCDASAFKNNALTSQTNDKSNQSSSSDSSSQSNSRANQQSANNQSSSSNSTDLSKMNRDQLFTTINAAINSKDWVKAYAGLQQLSKDLDPEISRQGIRKMGEYLYLGQGVKQNKSEAERLFEKASIMGDLDAYGHLCQTYKDREGAVNHKKDLDYCLYAAERGHPFAQAVLGWLYEQGDGITQNIQLSNNWTCKAAAQGEATAVGNVKKQNISCN